MATESYVAFQDKLNPNDWRVEHINPETGELSIALFGGPDAEKCAVEYTMLKNRTHPVFKRVTAEPAAAPINSLLEPVRNLYYAAVWHADRPVDEIGLWTAVRAAAGFEPGTSPKEILKTPVSDDRLEIVTTNGHELVIRPSELAWSYDAHRRNLTARPKPAIEIKRGITSKGKV
jgi:hypothetical protein